MYITNKHISRRTVLRGVGATVALPLLDAMIPARKAWASPVERTRLVCLEMVHGAAGSNAFGIEKNLWAPAAEGRDFDLTPTSLSPLEPFREYVTIVSNTDVRNAEAFIPPETGGDHFRSSSVFLTQSHPRQTEGSDVQVGTSLDQLYAQRFGQDTPIPSMQLSIENVDQSGGCSYGYACVYMDTISWASPTQPLPMIRDPRLAFDQLFGSGGTPEERAARRKATRSIIDWLPDEVARLKRRLGPADRSRLEDYLENIREIERRIQRTEERNASGEPRELPDAPIGVPDYYGEHVELMFDLMALAFVSDMTRVFSFKMSRDVSGRVFPESGVLEGFHNASHHRGREKNIIDLSKINRYHVSLVPYFLDKLKNTEETGSNLLEKTLLLYGSSMGDPNIHNHKRCPLFLAGHANGNLVGNLHIRAADQTPMANAMLTMLRMLGLEDLETFGDSTGELDLNASSVMPMTTA
ncbi:MAG TPA: DUF1552 domain-containing protein [Vicinamibacteria bacterium]|nr:DUF1552 domain-containing protein [Vicinamibacteria bacterium]